MASAAFQDCLYVTTALPPPPTQPLEGDVRADVAVVGAGYTGLSSAIHLGRRGVRVIVLEAKEIGFGASGRNHGHCIPVIRFADPERLRLRLGPDRGPKFIRFYADAAKLVFGLIDHYRIDCEAMATGTLEVAHVPEAMAAIERQCMFYSGLGKATMLFGRDEAARLTGSERYFGGWIHPEGGHLNPLGYARGLARAAISEGALVATGSPVLGIQPHGPAWCLATPKGSVIADKVIIATDAYTDDFWPSLKRAYFILSAYGIASSPLDRGPRATIVPSNHNVGDTRNDVHFYRFDSANRLIVGGLVEGWRGRDFAATGQLITERMKWIFPKLPDIEWKWFWQGDLAITLDRMPRIFAPAPGIMGALGYSGRGVPTATAMGAVLADFALGTPERELPVPVASPRPVPLRRILSVIVPRLRGSLNRWRDARAHARVGLIPTPVD